MPSEERKGIALDAIRPRIEMFQAAVAKTTDYVIETINFCSKFALLGL